MFKKILKFKEVSSTQDIARRFVHKNEDIAIFAYTQKKGRGRQKRVWYSPLGGLYLSLLLFPRAHSSSIPLLAALTIIRVLEDFGFSKLSVLWPNDVLLNNRKVCGVLCEEFKKAIICGIGLNVNITSFSHNLENATSLRIEAGHDFEIEEILDAILNRFEPFYRELQEQGLKIKEVLNYIAGIGESVEITINKKNLKGIVFGIDDDWALLLRDESGLVRKFYYGDVKRLRW